MQNKKASPNGDTFYFGGGEGDGKNATPLQRANWFDRFVAVKEVFEVSKAELFKGYKEERILPGGFTL